MDEYYCTDTNIVVSKQLHAKWRNLLNNYGKLYLYGMSGFGKTVNALAFATKNYSHWVHISAEQQDCLEKIEQYYCRNQAPKMRTLLIIDDLQWLTDAQQQQKLVQLLNTIGVAEKKLHCLLLGRAVLPAYLKTFYLTKQLTVEDNESLWLDQSQIELLLEKEGLGGEQQKTLAKRCLEISQGYPIAVCSILRQLKEGCKDFESIAAMARQDLYQYYDAALLSKWTKEQIDGLVRLAVYAKFNQVMADAVLGRPSKPLLESILHISSALKVIAADTYEFQPFFLRYLTHKQQQLSKRQYKQLYLTAAKCYESIRELKQALRCYKLSDNYDKMAKLIIELSENVDPDFARESEAYMEHLPKELEQNLPKLLGAKTLLYSYQMEVEKSNQCLAKLKELATQEMKSGKKGEMLKIYVRTLVALPHGTSEEMKEKLTFFSSYMLKYGVHLDNIIPTGNTPSVINGGLDFLSWSKNDKLIYPVMKKATELAIGKEAIGLADVCMGENLYEKNRTTQAVGYLTKGLSDASCKGSIRVEYAAVGVMARLFQSEGQLDTAEGTLRNIFDKAQQTKFLELIPNIRASLVFCALLNAEKQKVSHWIQDHAPDEHKKFCITDRFSFLMKARAYVSMDRYYEALYILNILGQYSELYNRQYLRIEINLLKAIIAYRQRQQWKPLFIETLRTASEYSYIHVISDQGAAVLPLWKAIDWEAVQLNKSYRDAVNKELKKMVTLYPNYLVGAQKEEVLSNKELNVIKLLAEGYTNSEIAVALKVSTSTAKFHIGNILKKLNAENRVMAVNIAKDKKLV